MQRSIWALKMNWSAMLSSHVCCEELMRLKLRPESSMESSAGFWALLGMFCCWFADKASMTWTQNLHRNHRHTHQSCMVQVPLHQATSDKSNSLFWQPALPWHVHWCAHRLWCYMSLRLENRCLCTTIWLLHLAKNYQCLMKHDLSFAVPTHHPIIAWNKYISPSTSLVSCNRWSSSSEWTSASTSAGKSIASCWWLLPLVVEAC